MNKKFLINNSSLILVILSIILIFLAYFFTFEMSIVETIYSVFGFFGGNGSIDDIQKSFFLKIAAITAPFSLIVLVVILFFEKIKKWYFLEFKAKNHFIIIGLNEKSLALANDLLTNTCNQKTKLVNQGYSKLLIVINDETNPYIEDLSMQGAIIEFGHLSNKNFLDKIKIQNAKTIVHFCLDDLENLEALTSLVNMRYCLDINQYIHLENLENYELLNSSIFSNINIKAFNSYTNSAQKLFMEHPLGENVETIQSKNQVKIAIVGFDTLGENILLEH